MPTAIHQLELSDLKRDWIEEAALLVKGLAERGQLPDLFSSDDLHVLLPNKPKDGNWWGCLMAKLRNEGKIIRTGSKPSTRESRNGAWIGAYRWRRVSPAGQCEDKAN